MDNENNNLSNQEETNQSEEQNADPGQNQQKETAPQDINGDSIHEAEEIIHQSLVSGMLGYVNFDGGSVDNTTTGAMISAERRKLFRRDVYVGIRDAEQDIEFLGRIVEGPFHSPHEIGPDSAITRTTVLHPERTKFRPTYYVYGTIEVLGQLLTGERIIPTPTRPRPYSEIYIFPPDRLQSLLEISGNVLLGELMGYENEKVEVRSNSENKNFLPRNVGIFGTVGSGKSNTTQVLIEEASNAGWAVVVIDVEGEYVKMNEACERSELNHILNERFDIQPGGIQNFQVYVPSSGESDAADFQRFKVPISQLDSSVIGDILEFSEPQFRLLETVIEESIRNNRSRPSTNRMGAIGGNDTARNTQLYTLQNLIDTLDNSGPFFNNLSRIEQNTGSVLRNKLINFGRSGMLDWNANNRISYLPVHDMMVGGKVSVLDVSETDDRSRNVAIAFVLKSLFDNVIETPVGEEMPSRGIPRPKVLLVIEEIHTFVSRQSAGKMRAVLDNLQIISRRGRKRWMSLALVSQQPGHVPDELFELANTRFIHQLKSASNLAPVKQTTGGVHEALWNNVPALGPGQCLLTGAVFKNPIFVSIRPSRSKRLHTS